MNAEQYLNEFLINRLPEGTTVPEFFEAAGDEAEEMRELADDIVELQTDAAVPADSTRTQSYDALAEERANIVANMNVVDSRTERESRERRLDDIQREMEAGSQVGGGKQAELGEKMSQLERMIDQVIERM
ncbi:hypothetical protein LG288_07025 [Idiomarina seosinensis]|uniref:hypothetical protein n=1 Tax=Idiomarina seosinensis TaxID=281739 RepID=UPI00384EB297